MNTSEKNEIFIRQFIENISSNFQIYWIGVYHFFRNIENAIVNASFPKRVFDFQFLQK